MKHNLVSLTSQVRLLFLTTLVVVLGVAFASQFSDNSPYNDGSSSSRIFELQEFAGDSEPPPLNDASADTILSEILFIHAKNLVAFVVFSSEVLPRLTFLFHIRPRSPPAQSSI